MVYDLFCYILQIGFQDGLSGHVDHFQRPGMLFRIVDGEGMVDVPAMDGELVGRSEIRVVDADRVEMEQKAGGVIALFSGEGIDGVVCEVLGGVGFEVGEVRGDVRQRLL